MQKNTKKYKKPYTPSFTLQDYIDQLKEIDKGVKSKKKLYGSTLIMGLMEEVGEIARAYLAEHGNKPTNKAAQNDETYRQEIGDLLVSIMRLAIEKKINLDHRIQYTIRKIKRRLKQPKV